MAATEKIGGVELSTYGLRLARLDGNMDLPPYKKIIEENDFESNLLILEENTVKIKLIGIYSTKPEMGTNISNFYFKVKSALKQNWTFTNHAFTEICVVDNVQSFTYGTGIELTVTLKIAQ